MRKSFDGLSVVNCELTSRCNKQCFCCGRRKLEKMQKTDWGDMDTDLACKIADWLPENIVVQFHSNGEPLLHPCFGFIVGHYKKQIKCLSTNGKLLIEKADEIIDNLDTLTISVIEDDPEADEQYEIVKKFLELKGSKKPFMVYRLLGNVIDNDKWYKLPGIVATRTLHNPMGSFEYKKKVTIPEVGICQDLLSHLVIDRYGMVSLCVRFDPDRNLVIGDINKERLIDIWNGSKRKYFLQEHIKGNRKCNVVCAKCEFWGIPQGG